MSQASALHSDVGLTLKMSALKLFMLSVQLIVLDYLVILSPWCSTTVSLENYPLYSWVCKLLRSLLYMVHRVWTVQLLIISNPIISFHIVSFISFHIISFHIISWLQHCINKAFCFISFYLNHFISFVSQYSMSCHFILYYLILFRIISFHFTAFLALVTSHLVCISCTNLKVPLSP